MRDDDENKKDLGKFKDEFNSLLLKEWLALNPKVYSINHQTLEDLKEVLKANEQKEIIEAINPKDIIEKNKKTCKGREAVVLRQDSPEFLLRQNANDR